MTERRLLAALIAVTLVVSTVSAAGVVAAVDADDGDVRVEQGDSGGLTVSLDNATFSQDRRSAVDLTVAGEPVAFDAGTPFADADWWGWEIPLTELPDGSLAEARVTVTYNGTEEFNRTMDLRHLAVDTASAGFDGEGGLTMNTTSAGLADDSVELRASPNDGDPVTIEGSIGDDGVLRFDRGQLESLLLPPSNVTLSGVDGGPQVAADGYVDLRGVAEPSASLRSGGVSVSSPLLVDGQQYHVTLTTDDPAGTYVVTANASAGRIELSNEYVTGAGSVRATLDDATVVEAEFAPDTALSGTAANGTVSITDGELPGGTIQRAIVEDGSGVSVLENVTQQAGEISLPTALSGDGSYSLVLLYDGTTAIVDVQPGGSSPPADDATATGTDDGGFALPGNSYLVGGGITVAVLFGVVLIGLWATSSDGGSGGTSGPRQLTIAVTDGYNDSRITDPVTVEVTPKERRTEEGYQIDATTQSYEITDGQSEIEVPRKTVELETTYNGVTTARTVDLADSGRVELTLGPVSRTLTVQDEADEPVAGATVAVKSGGQTHLTRQTDAHGRAEFDVSAGATDFEIAVDRDRFEPASRHVADPSEFPDTISLVEETGTLRVRTGVEGEPTDAVDLRIRAGEGTQSEAVPTIGESVEPGIYEFDEIRVGSYELLATVDAPKFDPDRVTVEVGSDESVTADLDVGFEFSIAGYRDDVSALRTAADGLVPSSQIDTAIHEYYASVAHALADLVESLPDRGDQFAATGVDPDAVAEALLETGQGVVGVVENALNTKQNVDLFNACAELPPASVEWDGFELEDLFDLTQRQRIDQTAAIRERIEELSERVAAEGDELSVVSPASDVLDELRDYARSTQASDATRNAAIAFVVVGFADAVDELFERRQLRKRLEYTRF